MLAVNLERAGMIDGLLAPLHAHERVRNARRIGMIWAWDIVGAPADFARRYARHALANGLLLRPIGSTLYAMPPYVLEEDTARHLADGALAALEATLAEARAVAVRRRERGRCHEARRLSRPSSSSVPIPVSARPTPPARCCTRSRGATRACAG